MYGSSRQDVNLSYKSFFASFYHNVDLARFVPCSNLTMITTYPFLEPNYSPSWNHIFSFHGELVYAPCEYVIRVLMSFRDARIRDTHIMYLNTQSDNLLPQIVTY